MDKRISVVKMHLEGIGIRSISRLEGVSGALIVYWIRHFGELISKELRRKPIPKELKEVQINGN